MKYFCANCEAIMDLDIHLRCSSCGSDSVDLAVRPSVTPEALAATYLNDLERLYEHS